jgi:23S rRNA (cytidine1920-2'-O)/16S rRNA (cytidine1409-2'-O)-methyltransferase
MKVSKSRLDLLVVARGLVQSRESARKLIMAGQVIVRGETILRPATMVKTDTNIDIVHPLQYVSRGGEKLKAALDLFQIDVNGCICADVGASTGGFTDCLLQAGAERIYAIDAGYGQLAWSLRNDPRVVVMERTNARYLDALPEPVDCVTIDASFISLKLLLPVAWKWTQPEGILIALIKPQFEAGRSEVGKGGVVRAPEIHRKVLHSTIQFAVSMRCRVGGLIRSPLRGPAGNIEFLLLLDRRSEANLETVDDMVERVLFAA